MAYKLPKLTYAYDALEPYIDAQTMEIHYTKHHQGYLNKMNAVLAKYPDLTDPLPDLLRSLGSLNMDEADRTTLRNNAGGFVNHSLYWEIMGPKKEQDAALIARIKTAFGSVDGFKEKFSAAALGRFGSGWAWLVEKSDQRLEIYSTPNQDSPYLTADKPLIGLDVWEHAYYLNYQNRRADYIKNWWNVLKLL